MTILRESPWIGDIWKEGEEQGMQQGFVFAASFLSAISGYLAAHPPTN